MAMVIANPKHITDIMSHLGIYPLTSKSNDNIPRNITKKLARDTNLDRSYFYIYCMACNGSSFQFKVVEID